MNITLNEIQSNPLSFELESDNYGHVKHEDYGITESIKKTENRIRMAINLARKAGTEINSYPHMLVAKTAKNGVLKFHKKKPYEAPPPPPEHMYMREPKDLAEYFHIGTMSGNMHKSMKHTRNGENFTPNLLGVYLLQEDFKRDFFEYIRNKGVSDEVILKAQVPDMFFVGGYRTDTDLHIACGVSPIFVLHFLDFLKDEKNHEKLPTDDYVEQNSQRIVCIHGRKED